MGGTHDVANHHAFYRDQLAAHALELYKALEITMCGRYALALVCRCEPTVYCSTDTT